MLNSYDINVILRFEKGFPADLLIRCIQLVEQGVYNSELMELKLLFEETVSFFDMPSNKAEDLFHKMQDDLAQYKGQTLRIETASEGSLLLAGVVISIASPLIILTFGESIKDAWKKTKLYKKIEDVLLWTWKGKVEDIGKNIEGAARDDVELMSSGVQLESKLYLDINNTHYTKIVIQISQPAYRKALPTYGENVNKIKKNIALDQKDGEDDGPSSSHNRGRGRIKH